MDLTVIIPVYNEAENIKKAISRLEKEVLIPHKLIIVYDFVRDNTLPAVRPLQKKYKNIKLIKNNEGNKQGVVNAIKTGFKAARKGAVLVMMADLADDPTTIKSMWQKINQGYDVVCGSRYMKGGKKIGGPFFKSFLSRLAGWTTPFLLGIPTRDLTNAYKMYKKTVIDKIRIESQGGFELSEEIVIKAHFAGFKIAEVPTTWKDRTGGESRFKLKEWLPKYIYWYFWGLKKRLGFRGFDDAKIDSV